MRLGAALCLLFALQSPPAPAPPATPSAPAAPSTPSTDDPNGIVRHALELLEDDKYEEALDLAGSAADRWPAHAPAQAALGDALFRRGDFEEAERHYRRAVELDPDFAAGQFGMGRILRTLGRYGEAAGSFSRAAALSPATPKYLRVLANHLARREDAVGMLKRYLELVKGSPGIEEESMVKNVEAWLALLVRMGDQPISEMVKKEPCVVPLQVFRGQAFVRMTVAGLRDMKFVFDTGATGLTVSPRIAARAKLSPIRPFTIAGTGAARTETGDLVVVPEIALGGGIVVRNVPATVRDPAGPEEGLIGPSLLAVFAITVDLKQRRLVFSTPGEAPGGATEPFRNVGGEIVIRARLNGQPLNALVDTGSATTIVARSALSRVDGLDAVPARWSGSGEGAATLGVGGALADRKVILKGTLGFAGRDYPAGGMPSGDLSGFSRSLESEVYVILGAPQLDDSPFTIDYGRMTLTFGQRPGAPAGGKPQR